MPGQGTLLGLLAAGGGALYLSMEKWRVTNHDPNPWTVPAFLNVFMNRHHYQKAIDAINGKLNSCYRSPRVNRIVGGVQPSVRSPHGSRHMLGLACDIRPRMGKQGRDTNLRAAADLLFEMAQRGELGPVRRIADEPGWIHIGWQRNPAIVRFAERPPGVTDEVFLRPEKPEIAYSRMRDGKWSRVKTGVLPKSARIGAA